MQSGCRRQTSDSTLNYHRCRLLTQRRLADSNEEKNSTLHRQQHRYAERASKRAWPCRSNGKSHTPIGLRISAMR